MNEKQTRWWLYVLKLENSKWYVGITSKTPEERFTEHKLGKRAAYWTMKHKPIKINLTKDLGTVSRVDAEMYENRVTRLLMKKNGINNVRGGDLRDVAEYMQRFGRFWNKDGWNLIAYIILLNLIIIWLVMDIYDWNLYVFISLILAIVIAALVSKMFDR